MGWASASPIADALMERLEGLLVGEYASVMPIIAASAVEVLEDHDADDLESCDNWLIKEFLERRRGEDCSDCNDCECNDCTFDDCAEINDPDGEIRGRVTGR